MNTREAGRLLDSQSHRRPATQIIADDLRVASGPPTATSIPDSALVFHYARLGWPIVPLSNGKIPTLRDWVDAATTERKTIIRWWRSRQIRTGVGILTGKRSGLIVVDIDTHDPDCRVDPWDFPPTLMSVTGSGGWHLYYRYPSGIDRVPNVIRVMPGVDLKADGGMVAAPPSIHTGTGRRYRWVPATDPYPDVEAITPLPDRLLKAATQRPCLTSTNTNPHLWGKGGEVFRPESFIRVVLESQRGERNNRLNWASFHAGRGVAAGQIGEGQIHSELLHAAMHVGLSQAEAERTIRSGMKAGMKKR